MSKNKKKFRAEIYQKLLQEIAQPEPLKIEEKIEPAQTTAVEQAPSPPPPQPIISETSIANPQLVLKEVQKIILLISVLILLILIVYFLGQKTNFINQFGDWLLRFFRVS